MGPWGQEEKEHLGEDEKRGGDGGGQSATVTEHEQGSCPSQVWSAVLCAAQEEGYLVMAAFLGPVLGGVPVGKAKGNY